MKYHFFYNPYSRGFRKKKWVLRPIADKFGWDCIHETIVEPSELRIRYQDIIDGNTIVVGLGGDGTLKLLVNAFFELTDKYSIFPCGTANVIAGELKITNDINVFLDGIENPEVVSIDVGKADDEIFILCTGVGLDAMAVHKVSPILKRIFGPIAYVLSFLRSLFQKRSLIKIAVDGEIIIAKSIIIQNFRNYAGPFYFNRNVSYNDGFLSLIILEDKKKYFFNNILNSVFLNKNIREKIDFKELSFLCEENELFFQIDGDEFSKKIKNIRCIPDILKVFVVK